MIPVYIGTYTRRESFVDGKGVGIYIYYMNQTTGELQYNSTVSGLINPSFMVVDSNNTHLYAVNEITACYGATGSVSAFSIDTRTANLTYINSQPTMGLAPCHLSLDITSRYVFAANYASGSICVLPIQDDGCLGEVNHVVQHAGSGLIEERQSAPHAHMVLPSPDGRFILAVDLGTDEILAYRLDQIRGLLLAADSYSTKLSPGTGPRHLRFHPNGRFVYVLGELSSTIDVFDYDQASAAFYEKQKISTLPDNYNGRTSGAEIQVHPSGKFVYASNRGHNSIAIFSVDAHSGKLSLTGHQSSQGSIPRHFTIDPSGSFLLVANQNSDNVVTFRIDQKTGNLSSVGSNHVPTPVCIQCYANHMQTG
jgi:6-phosphogluconolactonase